MQSEESSECKQCSCFVCLFAWCLASVLNELYFKYDFIIGPSYTVLRIYGIIVLVYSELTIRLLEAEFVFLNNQTQMLV